MSKILAAISLLLAVTVIGSSASKLPENLKVEVVTTEKLKDILKSFPNAQELPRRIRPEEKQTRNGVSPHLLMEYYLGVRVAGDFLIAHDAQSHSWGSPQDVEMTISYPSAGAGTGRIVSYVNILVRQSNDQGRAYVLSGGIGQRHIRIVVESYQTWIFDHDANFYGY